MSVVLEHEHATLSCVTRNFLAQVSFPELGQFDKQSSVTQKRKYP